MSGISAVLSMIGTYLIWADAQEINGKVVDILLELTRKVGTRIDHLGHLNNRKNFGNWNVIPG